MPVAPPEDPGPVTRDLLGPIKARGCVRWRSGRVTFFPGPPEGPGSVVVPPADPPIQAHSWVMARGGQPRRRGSVGLPWTFPQTTITAVQPPGLATTHPVRLPSRWRAGRATVGRFPTPGNPDSLCFPGRHAVRRV